MSDLSQPPDNVRRCPNCDSVLLDDAGQCIMCGEVIVHPASDNLEPPHEEEIPQVESGKIVDPSHEVSDVFESRLLEQKSRSLLYLTLTAILITVFVSFLLLRSQDANLTLALVPTITGVPPTLTYTPTWTPFPSETSAPSATPTYTRTSAPTNTPRPPRFHSVAGGETLFGISLLYRISTGSIADENGLPANSPIQIGQQLNIPWPTATPPLESLLLEVQGETLIADVTDCEIVVIHEGDSAYGLSGAKGVPVEAIIAVNRLTEETIELLHPGDTLCIPEIIYSDTLPPTPGPAPTLTATSYPAGPELLYPINLTSIDPEQETVTLQWVAVKDLADNEWYMVELTNTDQLDAIPLRDFTRDNAFRLPSSWRPVVPEEFQMRWRVSIVQVTGERADGAFLFKYGGRNSSDAFFNWLGAIPTSTSIPTPTITPTPER